MSITWKDYKEEAIAKYRAGVTVKELAEEYGSCIPNIIGGLQRAGVYQYKTKRWSQSEIEYLKQNYSTAAWDDLLSHLPGRSKEDLISKASDLGIKRECFFWSQEDIAKLIDAYNRKATDKELVDIFDGRFTLGAIATKATKLGLRRRIPWTDNDMDLLRRTYSVLPMQEVLKLFPGRNAPQLHCKARKMGLHAFRYLERQWLPDEDEFIRQNWDKMTDQDMATYLGRTFRATKFRRVKLGIQREVLEGEYTYLRDYLWKAERPWRKDSIAASGYRCVVTGGQFQDVHHLYSVNMIIQEALDVLGFELTKVYEYTKEQLDQIEDVYLSLYAKYPLGICLSHEIHMQFHREYGFGNNTPEQFEDFLSKHYPSIHIPVTINAA